MLTKNIILAISFAIFSTPSLAGIEIDKNNSSQKEPIHQHYQHRNHKMKDSKEKIKTHKHQEKRKFLVEMIDRDGDGKISKEEFLIHQDKIFLEMDKNQDGYIQQDELKRQKHRKYKK